MLMFPPEEALLHFIEESLAEDLGDGDHSSLACIPRDHKSKAKLLVKDYGILAGVSFASFLWKTLDPGIDIRVYKKDGMEIHPGDVAFEVSGHTRTLLKGERLMLNVMQRMSGIATQASLFNGEVEGLQTKVLDTRKTTPFNRWLEKWAVNIGGCYNYRFGLFDRIMIKDNHIDACGSITTAIDRVREYLKRNDLNLEITIEVRNLNELSEVMKRGGVNRIMFDNFEIPLLKVAVEIVDGKYETEASGGIVLNTVRKYAETGVDFVSSGALTHTVDPLDLSFKIAAN